MISLFFLIFPSVIQKIGLWLVNLSVVASCLSMLFLAVPFSETLAQNQALPDPGEFLGNRELIKVPEGDDAASKFNYLIKQNIIPIVKFVFISVAIAVLIYYGIQLVLSGSEDVISAQKDNLLFAALGFALLGIATHIVDAFDPLSAAGIGVEEEAITATRKIILYVELIVGAIASLMITFSAVRMITSQGDEQQLETEKKYMTWGGAGLIIIMLSEAVVQIVYEATRAGAPAAGASDAVAEIVGVILFLLQFLGILAVLALIIGGFYLVSSFGNEEATNKAKNILMGAGVGIVLIITSYTFVATFLR